MIDIDTLNTLSKFDGTSSGDVERILHCRESSICCLMKSGLKAYLPNYFNDSNAIRDLIECATEENIAKYAQLLAFSFGRYPPGWLVGDVVVILSSTTEQQAMAFYEMIKSYSNNPRFGGLAPLALKNPWAA
jgi:hypothetical protein